MATFHFELVSPQKIAFSGEVDQVDVPGAEGDFGVLAGPCAADLADPSRRDEGHCGAARRPRSSCSAASPRSVPMG